MYITRAQAKSGDVLAVVAPHGAMMVQGATPSQAEWLWEAIRSGSSFQQLVEALGFGVRPSRQIPAFAIAVSEGEHLRVALRGAFRACDRDGNVLGTGMETPTWNEAFIDRMADLVLDAGPGAGVGRAEGLPFADGIAATSALLLAFVPGHPEIRGAAADSRAREAAAYGAAGSSPAPGGYGAADQGAEAVAAPQAVQEAVGASEEPVEADSAAKEESPLPVNPIDALEKTRMPLDEPTLDAVSGADDVASAESAEEADEPSAEAPFFIDSVPGDFHTPQAEEEEAERQNAAPVEAEASAPAEAEAPAAQTPAAEDGAPEEEDAIPAEELEEIAANLSSAGEVGDLAPEEDVPEEQPRFPIESRFPMADQLDESEDAAQAAFSPVEAAEGLEQGPTDAAEESAEPAEEPVRRSPRPWEVADEAPSSEEPAASELADDVAEAAEEPEAPVEGQAGWDGPQQEEAFRDDEQAQESRPFEPSFPRVAAEAAEAGASAEDYDVETVVGEQSPQEQERVQAESPQAMVLAVLCQNGHLNPPHGKVCRICSGPLGGEPNWYPRPSLGEIWVSTGLNVPLDADIIIGRKPASAPEPGRPRAHLVPVPSPDQQISRTHCEIRVDNWDVRLVDRNSNNGTYVLRPNERPIRISPTEPFFLRVSDVIDIGEGVTIQMLGPRSGA